MENCSVFFLTATRRRKGKMEELLSRTITNQTNLQQVQEYLTGTIDLKTLPDDEKWCIFMKYRHEERATPLIQELCRKEEGIMRAEKVVTKVDRDLIKYGRWMAEGKNKVDRMFAYQRALKEAKEAVYKEASAAGHAKGHAEGLVKGHAEGEAKGELAGYEKANLENAKKMKALGDSFERIQIITGLSIEVIEGL